MIRPEHITQMASQNERPASNYNNMRTIPGGFVSDYRREEVIPGGTRIETGSTENRRFEIPGGSSTQRVEYNETIQRVSNYQPSRE